VLVGVNHRSASGQKSRARFELIFNIPLDAAAASSIHNYRVTQPGRFRHSRPRTIVVHSALYDPASRVVTLKLGPSRKGRPLNLTITGLVWAGVPSTSIATTL
jgi:hypothetical protein